jgi:hypothetical protein
MNRTSAKGTLGLLEEGKTAKRVFPSESASAGMDQLGQIIPGNPRADFLE